MKGISRIGFATLLIASAMWWAVSCVPRTPLPYSLESPPLILAPASATQITDFRGRFRQIYCAIETDHGASLPDNRPCSSVVHRLLGEPAGSERPVFLGKTRFSGKIVVVPGIFGECIEDLVNPFSHALAHLSRAHGYSIGMIKVSGLSSSAYNAKLIKEAIFRMGLARDEKLILLGYSKGIGDILEALILYPEIVDLVVVVVSVAGAVSGTPLAERSVDLYSNVLKKMNVGVCPPGDRGGVKSLTRSARLNFLAVNKLPQEIQYFSLVAFSQRKNISRVLKPSYDQLAKLDPRNDSQVIFHDAIIPGSVLLGYVNADHWAVTLPFSRNTPVLARALIDKNAFPREVLLEAIIRSVEEVLSRN